MIGLILTLIVGVLVVLGGNWLKIGFLEVFLVEWLLLYMWTHQKYKSFLILLMVVIVFENFFSLLSLEGVLILYGLWIFVLWSMNNIFLPGRLIYNFFALASFLGIYWVSSYQGITDSFWFWWMGNIILNLFIFQSLTSISNKKFLYEIIYK